MRLENKRAIVTGGGSGIGQAIARRFAAEGARVAVFDMNADAAAETIKGLPEGRHLSMACDIGDSAAVDAAVARVVEAFGGVDVLVNNAGTGRGPNDGSNELYAGQAERQAQIARGEMPTAHPDQTIYMSDEGWRHVLNVNLNGAFWCARAVVRNMAADNRGGSIINIASTSSVSGEGPIHYVTSKAAVIGLTRGLARELSSRGVRVNAINPGPTNTPIMQSIPDAAVKALEANIPLGRMAHPMEVANAALFLASDESSYATGSTVTVNGGTWFI